MIYQIKLFLLLLIINVSLSQAQDSTIFIQQKFYDNGEFISSDTLLETWPLSNVQLRWDQNGRLIAMSLSSNNGFGWSEQADYYTSMGKMKLDYRKTVFDEVNSSRIRVEQFSGSVYNVEEVIKVQVDSLNISWELIYNKENELKGLYGYRIVGDDTLFSLSCFDKYCYLDSTKKMNSNYSEVKSYIKVHENELNLPECMICGVLNFDEFVFFQENVVVVSKEKKEVKIYSLRGGVKVLIKETIYYPCIKIQKKYFIR